MIETRPLSRKTWKEKDPHLFTTAKKKHHTSTEVMAKKTKTWDDEKLNDWEA